MPTKRNYKLSRNWIIQTRAEFKSFLEETEFPDPTRMGERGPDFKYPEWLIMFIAILAVKAKIKHYVAIHRMVCEFWDVIAQDLKVQKISERQLRDRLKKIGHSPRRPATFIFQLFPELERTASRQRG